MRYAAPIHGQRRIERSVRFGEGYNLLFDSLAALGELLGADDLPSRIRSNLNCAFGQLRCPIDGEDAVLGYGSGVVLPGIV